MPSQSLDDIRGWLSHAVADAYADPASGSPLLRSVELFLGHGLRASAQSPSWVAFLSEIPERELEAIAGLVPAGAARAVIDVRTGHAAIA